MSKLFLSIYGIPISGTIISLILLLLLWSLITNLYINEVPAKIILYKLIFTFFLILWTFAILYQTVLSRTSSELVVHWDFFHQLKEYLFNNGDKELLRTLWMNVLLFVPGGLLLETLWPPFFPRWVCIPLTIILLTALSVGIEAVQYRYALGIVEADDVLCNGLGAALGVVIHECAVLLSRKLPHK